MEEWQPRASMRIMMDRLTELAGEAYDVESFKASSNFRQRVRDEAIRLYWLCDERGPEYTVAVLLMALTRPERPVSASRLHRWTLIAYSLFWRAVGLLGGLR